MTIMDQVVHFIAQHAVLSIAFLLALCFFAYEEYISQNRVPMLSVQEVVCLLNNEEIILYDLRDKLAYATQHIAQSTLISMEVLSEKVALSSGKKIALVLPNKHLYKVQGYLNQSKVKTVFILRGGMAAWIEAGMPVNRMTQKNKIKKRKSV